MMTKFVCWKLSEDVQFRERYEDLTGEKIQDFPISSEDKLIVGTTRLESDAVQFLLAEFETVRVFDEIPSEFINTGVPE
ncbi:MAG: hypothetical protein AAFO69_04910 [Bacteroidota bacterium]